jgi:hypothetical protein
MDSLQTPYERWSLPQLWFPAGELTQEMFCFMEATVNFESFKNAISQYYINYFWSYLFSKTQYLQKRNLEKDFCGPKDIIPKAIPHLYASTGNNFYCSCTGDRKHIKRLNKIFSFFKIKSS